MTTIIGIDDLNDCELIADAQTTSDNRPYRHSQLSKLVRRGDYILAAAGSGYACDLVQYVWMPPPWDGSEPAVFIRSVVVPHLRGTLEGNDWQPNTEKDETLVLLIALAGRIFQIESDFTVLMRSDGMYAIGSGAGYAIGALEAGASSDEAMQIAARNDIYTGLPAERMVQVKP